MTIKQIAKMAMVSVATVSHVINKTRYVSPNLVNRVERVIQETGYLEKVRSKGKDKNFRIGKKSEIAFVVPNISSVVYARLTMELSDYLREKGYLLTAYITKDESSWEKHILTCLMSNKNIAGIFLTPTSEKAAIYEKLIRSGIPTLCLERMASGVIMDSILSENAEGTYRGTRHLIRSGHQRIGILVENHGLSTTKERLAGYRRALNEYDIAYDKSLVKSIDLYSPSIQNIFEAQQWKNIPSAFIAGGNTLTLKLLKDMDEVGLECPKDISVVGFGDDAWSSVTNPALTSLTQDTAEIARCAVSTMLSKLDGNSLPEHIQRVPVNITVRKSTRVINRGPFGEIAVSPEDILFTDAEQKQIRLGNFKVAISFHYTGTEWTRLHEAAIRDTLSRYGVQVIAVMDANFDPALQVTQLEAIRMQKPDAIIGVPADENVTAGKFKDLSKTTKLVLIGNVPQGLNADDYYSCVSVNERENGQNAGKILGEYLKGKGYAKVAMLNHGLPFHMTKQRDAAAEQVLVENYPNIEIVDQRSFYKIGNAYSACREVMDAHPEVTGLYVSWERPALEAIRALRDIGRADVSLVTVDLDRQIAEHMQIGEIVRGVSAQRPYEQGEAAALATIQALLGKREYKFVGVQPVVVLPKELARLWREILHIPAPDFLKR